MSRLEGCRVLVVEDESLVAMHVEDLLADMGCTVVLAMRLDAALRLARTADLDFAVLDVNLGEGRSYPVAGVLHARGIPFLFATGYGVTGLDPAYRTVPTLQKPFRAADLARLAEHLLARDATAAGCGASRPKTGDGSTGAPT